MRQGLRKGAESGVQSWEGCRAERGQCCGSLPPGHVCLPFPLPADVAALQMLHFSPALPVLRIPPTLL